MTSRSVLWIFALLLVGIHGLEVEEEEEDSFSPLIPEQSCLFAGYNGELTCTCASNSNDVSLDIPFSSYTSRFIIQRVLIKQCNRIKVSLDLRGLQAGGFPVIFKSIRSVDVEELIFDPSYNNRQELRLEFDNVESFRLNGLDVNETLRLTASNVKDAHIVGSYFKHIPPQGFVIKSAKDLLVKDSFFRYVEPRSILVEDAKSVLVMGNQMPINALQVVQAVDGSHLMISCNRLLEQPVSPECSKTTMTSTTTTTTTTTFIPPIPVSKEFTPSSSSSAGPASIERRVGVTPEVVGGIIAGLLVIIFVLVILICLLKRKKKQHQKQQQVLSSKGKDSGNLEAGDLETKIVDPLSSPEKQGCGTHLVSTIEGDGGMMKSKGRSEVGEEPDEDEKPKFASPIWIDEIQRNKIFNRQRSLLSHEDLKSRFSSSKDFSDGEEDENSRTESDEEFAKVAASSSSSVEADISYSPLKDEKKDVNDNNKDDLEELESLLARVREQERSLIEGDDGKSSMAEDVTDSLLPPQKT